MREVLGRLRTWGGRRPAWWVGGCAALATLLLRVPYLGSPLDNDEGHYWATVMVSHTGRRLYADLYSVRPPFLFTWYGTAHSLANSLGLSPDVALRLIVGLAVAAAAFLLVTVTCRLLSPTAGIACGVAFSLLAGSPRMQSVGANAEVVMLPAYTATGALVALAWFDRRLSRRGALLCAAVAGLSCALAAGTKQVAGVAMFLPAVALLADRDRLSRYRLLVAYGAGVVAVVLGVALWALATRQAAAALVFGGLANLVYVRSELALSVLAILRGVVPYLAWAVGAPLVAFSFLASLALRPKHLRDRTVALYALAWLLLSCAGVAASRRFYPHYFVQLIPAMALLAGVGTQTLTKAAVDRRLPTLRSRLMAASLLAAGFVFLGVSTAGGLLHLGRYNEAFYQTRDSAQVLSSVTAPRDRVFVWGGSEILAYANRLPSTRVMTAFYPLRMIGPTPGQSLLGVPLTSGADLILEDLGEAPPRAVVLSMPLDAKGNGLDRADDHAVTALLSHILREDYRLVARVGPRPVEVYVRR